MNDIWKSLASRLSEAEELPRRLDYSTLPKTTDVIDEEKSVRWNREEVERRRKAWIVIRQACMGHAMLLTFTTSTTIWMMETASW